MRRANSKSTAISPFPFHFWFNKLDRFVCALKSIQKYYKYIDKLQIKYTAKHMLKHVEHRRRTIKTCFLNTIFFPNL